jgi:hypothetical protein
MRVMRKTIEVKGMVEWANTQLARTDEYADVGFKSGISTMVERVLFNSKNYNGFQFINNDDSEVGTVGYYSRYYTLPKT